MGRLVTPQKSLEDMLAEYTEDLMAERRTRIPEDLAAMDEAERAQLVAMLALVRQLKAGHREAPAPSESFLHRLDSLVREEVAKQVAPVSRPVRDHTSAAGDFRSAAGRSLLTAPILQRSRRFFEALRGSTGGVGWRSVGAAIAMVLLGLQVLLYLQVRQLEQQNQALVARLGPHSPPVSLVPLGLPQGERTIAGKEAPTPKTLSGDDLIAGVELRVRIEQRIAELEKELETTTGRDRQIAEALLRELRGLLRSSQKP